MEKVEATILIVDDERINRMLLKSFLGEGYSNLLEAGDGQEALKLMNNNDVDLVLLDVMMPVMSGFDVLKIVRKHPRLQNIPIIVITALSSIKDNAKAIEFGADGFLTKPFNKIVLGAMVKNLLKQNEMQKRLVAAEKNEIFLATVVTANHEINQPLTSILCSANLLEKTFEGNRIKDPESFKKYIMLIETSVKKISDTLKKLRAVKGPTTTGYVDSVRMIDLESPEEKSEPVTDIYKVVSRLRQGGKANKIFIIDQNNSILEPVKESLSERGLAVSSFSDYQVILERFKEDPTAVDLVMIDLTHPTEGGGLRLFRQLKDINKNVKIILSSGDDVKGGVVDALKNGAEAFLPKPYDIDDLAQVIEKALTDAP